jgi:UDP-N-acetylmuramate--alanine ligase
VSGEKLVKTVDFSGDSPFHFIGVGGIGMSALAYILAKQKFKVSGSDLSSSRITDRLQEVGVTIFQGQAGQNLTSHQHNGHKPQVICSSAIALTNPEYQAACELNYPTFHRSDVLAGLIENCESIAVAGTHGKTTTSSLIGYLLLQAGLDPTIIIGGEVEAWEGNARLGESRFLVAEADESDGSLVKHHASIGVITNIELDHPDHYADLASVVKIFQTFAQQCAIVVTCLDCPTLAQEIRGQITYSLNPASNADYKVSKITYHDLGSTAAVWEKGEYLGEMELKIPGKHNISNALAAVAVGRYLGLDFPVIAAALATFGGAKRRFEYRGEAQGITFIDDYAHHPSELEVTLAAARLKITHNDYKRVVAVFQPHRYSRTVAFLEEFSRAFQDADLVVLTDIYSAGESNPQQITGEQVADLVATNHPQVLYHQDLSTLPIYLTELLQPGDLVLFLGAGNLNQKIPEVMTLLITSTN